MTTATPTTIGHTAYSLDGITWTSLPVGPRFDDPMIGLDQSEVAFRTPGGVLWTNENYTLDHWEFTFRLTLSQVASFRAMHDLVRGGGSNLPFYFTLNKNESPVVAVYVTKEPGFLPRGLSGAPRNPPMFEYRMILTGYVDPLTVLT